MAHRLNLAAQMMLGRVPMRCNAIVNDPAPFASAMELRAELVGSDHSLGDHRRGSVGDTP